MKKIISIILVCTMILNLGVFAYADVNNSNNYNNSMETKIIIDPKLPKDIKLLTVDELENVGTISIDSVPGPGGAILIGERCYRTYENVTESFIVGDIVGYLIGGFSAAVAKIVGKTVLKTVFAKIIGWISAHYQLIKPIYVCSWVSASYSNTYDQYIYYATLVNYKYDNYTNVIKVQYYEVGRSNTLER